jgi:transcriptional regulator with XRE-family HTH domain
MQDAAAMLRMARRRAGLSQRELARRADVPQPTVSRIERGRISPSLDTLGPLIEACGMALEVVERPGAGVDRGQIEDGLRRSPRERLEYAVASARAIGSLRARAREVTA